ncbi:hypothetical protein GCM10011313_22750 [Mycetocola zhadangensis]|nr:hypothetical protein GCM10011313_22750 [Mycetocola zhadangensis]
MRRIGVIGLYLLIPGLSAVTPLLVLPALTTAYGAVGLTVFGVAQSLGGTAAIMADLGWGVLGPQKVAHSTNEKRSSLYVSAAATRLSALALLAPVAALASFLIVDGDKGAAAVIALGFSAAALSPSWYLIGCNRPLTILWVEGLPKIVAAAVCAVAYLQGAPLFIYGLALVAAAILTWTLSAFATGNGFWPGRGEFKRGASVMREHFPLTIGRTIGAVYTTLPIAIVAVAAPSAAPLFTAVERLMRMALSLLGGFPSRLQSWVGADRENNVKRSRQSLLLNCGLGVFAGVGFAFLAPWVADFVFSGVVDVPLELTAIAGAVILTICASRGLGLSMVAEKKGNWIALANIAAAAVGVPAVFFFSGVIGAKGALFGELLAEFIGLVVQGVILFGGLSRIRWRRGNR